MTYRGQIINGAVVLENPVDLPDGSKVQCELIAIDVQQTPESDQEGALFSDLMEFSGSVKGTPRDGARNHDHYLYGSYDA